MASRYITNHAFTSLPATGQTFPNGRQVVSTFDALYRRTEVRDQGAGSAIATWEFLGPGRVAEVRLGNGLIGTHLVRGTSFCALLIISLFCLATSCTDPNLPSSIESELRSTFLTHQRRLEELVVIVLQQSGIDAIGIDRIGDYWRHGAEWNTNRGNASSITEDAVLAQYRISRVEYQQLCDLLATCGGYRVEKTEQFIKVCMRRSGTLVRGEVWSFVAVRDNGNGPHPVVSHVTRSRQGQDGGGKVYVSLGGGWYIEYDHD